MKRNTYIRSIVCLAFLCLPAVYAASQEASAAKQQQLVETYGRLPLSFEANQGQTASQVNFLSRGSGYSLFLTPGQAVLALLSDLAWRRLSGLVCMAKAKSASPECRVSVSRITQIARVSIASLEAPYAVPPIAYFSQPADPSWRTRLRHAASTSFSSPTRIFLEAQASKSFASTRWC